MSVYKDPKTGKWFCMYRIKYIRGKRKQIKKTGFETKELAYKYECSKIVDGDLYYNTDDYSYVYNLEDINITSYNDYNEKYIINHKSNEKKSYLYVGFNNYYEYDFYVYKLNQEKYNEFVKKLESVKVNIVDFKEDVINLNVSSKEGTIYSSIPYDDGWHVYINGKEISKFRIGNAFLGFDVLDGDNDIKLIYKIPYLGLGLFISCSSVFLLSLEIYLLRKKSH